MVLQWANTFGIDAVAISDSKYAIIPEISKPELLAAGLTVQGLDEKVNSEYSELNPLLLSPDGKTLYFSRKNHPENVGGITDKEDIWYSELDSTGRWKLAQNLTPLNNPGPNFINYISSVTPDGKSAIVLLGNQYNEKGKMLGGCISEYKCGWKLDKTRSGSQNYRRLQLQRKGKLLHGKQQKNFVNVGRARRLRR